MIRFAIGQIISELETELSFKKKPSNSLKSLFSVTSVQTQRCSKGHLITKPSTTYVVEVDCSSKASFLTSLERALNGEKKSSLWCDQCKEDASGESEKTILSLPQSLIVVINQSTPASDQVALDPYCHS